MKTENIPAIIKRMAERGYLGSGNVISDLQFSGYVRPHCETECNGFTNPPGKLRAFDLDGFRKFPNWIARGLVESLGELSVPVVLYVWRRHRPGFDNGAIIYGATVADGDGRILVRRIMRPRYFVNCDIVAFLESRYVRILPAGGDA